jgi:hypothetical protein
MPTSPVPEFPKPLSPVPEFPMPTSPVPELNFGLKKGCAQAGRRARPSANSDIGSGAHIGNVHSRRAVSTSNPAPTIERSVSRCVWQLPSNLGQKVASTNCCDRPRRPSLATCSRYRSCPPGRSHERRCRSTMSGSLTEHSTSEHTTASDGSPPTNSSTVSQVSLSSAGQCIGWIRLAARQPQKMGLARWSR